MWQEEKLGTITINKARTEEAVATGADQIAVGCPFYSTLLADGLTTAQSAGDAREDIEVLDVAQLLLASVKRRASRRRRAGPRRAAGAPTRSRAAPAGPRWSTSASAAANIGSGAVFDFVAGERGLVRLGPPGVCAARRVETRTVAWAIEL
jgi:hypothetical protein